MKKSLVKHIQIIVLSLMLILFFSGCETQEILVPEIEFFISKEWKIESVFKQGYVQTNDSLPSGYKLESYRLILNDDFTLEETSLSGQIRGGTWRLTSGLTQLVLFVETSDEQRWLLLDLEVRNLEMRLLQDPRKPQLDIRYILKPIRGQ